MRLAFAEDHCIHGDSQISLCLMEESYGSEASPSGILLVCPQNKVYMKQVVYVVVRWTIVDIKQEYRLLRYWLDLMLLP